MTTEQSLSRWRIARTIEPTLDAVDRVCVDVRNRLKDRCSPGDWYGVELLLREALTNAVVHGCAGGAGPAARAPRCVRCDVYVGARGARMVISDDGPGFDWRRTLERETLDTATCGRGLKIYEMYADRVTFNRTGNRVVLVRRFGVGETRT